MQYGRRAAHARSHLGGGGPGLFGGGGAERDGGPGGPLEGTGGDPEARDGPSPKKLSISLELKPS